MLQAIPSNLLRDYDLLPYLHTKKFKCSSCTWKEEWNLVKLKLIYFRSQDDSYFRIGLVSQVLKLSNSQQNN